MISEKIKKLFAENSPNSNKDLVKIINDIQNLNAYLDTLVFKTPDEFNLGYLTTYDLEKVSKFSNGLPREFIISNLYENLYFLSFTQIKQLLNLYKSLLEDEKYYSSVIVLRSLLEVVAFASYPLSKAEKIMSETLIILKNATNTKSQNEKFRLPEKYGENLHLMCESAYDWFHSSGDFLTKNMNEKYGIDTSAFPKNKLKHIHDAVRKIDKLSKKPVFKFYEMLSQCSHPNIGSRLLMIETITKHFPGMDKMTISSANSSEEGKIYYYEQFSEGLLLTLQLTLALIQRYKRYLDLFNSLFEYSRGAKDNVIH